MIRAKMAYGTLLFWRSVLQLFKFRVFRFGAYEYLYENFRECSSFISRFYSVFLSVAQIGRISGFSATARLGCVRTCNTRRIPDNVLLPCRADCPVGNPPPLRWGFRTKFLFMRVVLFLFLKILTNFVNELNLIQKCSSFVKLYEYNL